MHQCRWWHKIIQSIDSVSHISCHYLITAPQTIYFVNGWNMRVGVNCNIWLSWWESYYKGELTVTLIDFPVTLVFNFWKFRTLSLTTVLPCRTTQDIKSHHSHLMITVGIKAQVKQKCLSSPICIFTDFRASFRWKKLKSKRFQLTSLCCDEGESQNLFTVANTGLEQSVKPLMLKAPNVCPLFTLNPSSSLSSTSPSSSCLSSCLARASTVKLELWVERPVMLPLFAAVLYFLVAGFDSQLWPFRHVLCFPFRKRTILWV